jgi:hypothetical protein
MIAPSWREKQIENRELNTNACQLTVLSVPACKLPYDIHRQILRKISIDVANVVTPGNSM